MTLRSDHDSDDESLPDDSVTSSSSGGLTFKKMEKVHPAYSLQVSSAELGKVIKSTKVKHEWVFVFPEDAVDRSVALPLDARTTKIGLIHSTVSSRIEVFVNDELSFASLMEGVETPWKVAKRAGNSPIVFDVQRKMRNHDVRVTIKNASEKHFHVSPAAAVVVCGTRCHCWSRTKRCAVVHSVIPLVESRSLYACVFFIVCLLFVCRVRMSVGVCHPSSHPQYFLHVDGVSFTKMPAWRGPIPVKPRVAAVGAPADVRTNLEDFLE